MRTSLIFCALTKSSVVKLRRIVFVILSLGHDTDIIIFHSERLGNSDNQILERQLIDCLYLFRALHLINTTAALHMLILFLSYIIKVLVLFFHSVHCSVFDNVR